MTGSRVGGAQRGVGTCGQEGSHDHAVQLSTGGFREVVVKSPREQGVDELDLTVAQSPGQAGTDQGPHRSLGVALAYAGDGGHQ